MGATKSQGFFAKPKRKGGDVSPDLAKGLAVSAADSIRKFHETHYAMVRDFSEFVDARSQVTVHDHVHYHVYGDYRLNLSELIGPDFDAVSAVQPEDLKTAMGPDLTTLLDTISSEYHTVPTTISRMVQAGGQTQYLPVPMLRFKVANYKLDTTRGTAIETDDVGGSTFLRVPRLNAHLITEGHSSRANLGVAPDNTNGCDKLNGFINAGENTGDFVRVARTRLNIEPRLSRWSNNQLHSGTQATRFFLPSLGTILVSGERIDGLKEYVGARVEYMEEQVTEGLADNKYNLLPEFHYHPVANLDARYAGGIRPSGPRGIITGLNALISQPSDRLNEDTDYITFFLEWAKSIITHPDYRHYLEVTLAEDLDAENIDIITSLGGTPPEPRFLNAVSGALRNPSIIPPILPKRIMTIAVQATSRSESDEFNDGIYEAGKHFMNQLMNEGRADIVMGTAVRLTDSGKRRLAQTLVHLNPDDEDDGGDAEILEDIDEDDTFYINEVENKRYQLSYTLSNGRTILLPITAGGVENPNSNMWFKREHFNVFDEDKNEELDEETIQEEGYKGQVNKLHRVFLRIVMDCYMTIETYTAILTGNINTKKANKFSRANQDPNMRALAARERGGGGGGKKEKKGKKDKPGLAEILAELRTELSLGQLVGTYLTTRGDSSRLQNFYSQDLTGAEILWLSNSISDFNPNLVSATPSLSRNQLVQQVYIPPQNATQYVTGTATQYVTGTETAPSKITLHRADPYGVLGGVPQNQVVGTSVTAPTTKDLAQEVTKDFAQEVPYAYDPVKPTTIFLRLDSALLRDILIEYVRQHNLFITEVARTAVRKKGKKRQGKGGNQKKGNQNKKASSVLPTMWMLIKQMATQVLLLDDAKPHVMWNNLFDSVDRYRTRQTMQHPMIPEHWAQTFTVANLRKDPELTGTTPNIEEQAELLSEYTQFLESVYFQDFGMIAEIATGLDIARIEMISDLDVLKRYFVERMHEDTSSKFLDRALWNGYQSLIYIMRTFADIPAELRGEYTASRFDEDAISQMREQASQMGTQLREPVYGQVEDVSPRFMREGQVYRPPGF
ncbi:hypothetical protein N9N26_00910 [Candidatus Poseidoniales archaeon]|nr:hypothetical protein [Candidatus Poseidoniales archaeon]